MTLRNSGTFAPASLALIGTLWFSPAFAQDENPTTPGAIPNPSTYQGSTELQHQSDQQDQQFRQQQQQQPSYSGQPQQGGYRSSQSSGGQPPPPPWVECFRHVAEMRALAPIAGKVTLGFADPARVELFDDQTKPTAAEKILLAKWDEARRYCWSLLQEDPRNQTAPERYMDSHWGFPASHALITQLLNGQLTFGQFNYQRAMNARAAQRYRNQPGNH